ncbi:regulatory protein RecX [Muriicola soli]|uniref:Regulatory protein RecX n=1 Tax=Muriicola soli TaxID=2507538 RepID=A0A411ECD1_9FLAO|nr:regulatory protein RecX [Muriicola soli]QBA65157.1 RecX family transcriptional regulator [Muriicola soli]
MLKRKAYTLTEATRKIEHYCAYQERCHQEVVQKLREMHMIPEAIDQIMGHLISENYLNEERFARSFARGKFRIKSWGRNRISLELKKRNISPTIINIALRELEEPAYSDTLESLAKKRFKQLKGLNPWQQKKKLGDYLLYRGWESDLVYEQINRLVNKK